jgi:hypothetical protein
LTNPGSGTFAPSLGQSFDILKADGGFFGAFSILELPSLTGNLDWQIAYLADQVRLSVVEGTALLGDFTSIIASTPPIMSCGAKRSAAPQVITYGEPTSAEQPAAAQR